ncbi:MAG: dTDP-4-dehydrorhamnose 3,5-epimerase family protein [Flavobacteriales bacterium]|jgi:dTDP-4-dehydrorhamnose 3,5-epimerase|nr:dTDP-4-dehydrorhamnose 3,5-epimerase family protein [Flavobacteriales bacterium]
MKSFKELNIPGVFEIDMFHAGDDRGLFVKPYHKKTLDQQGLVSDFQESFYSTNKAGVIRGMHFQRPPYDHTKIVYCTSGRLLDVILDIREGSPTYGKCASVELTGSNFKSVYLPTGVAHGFCVLEDNTNMIYLTSTMHAPSADDGIRFDSFGFDWPLKKAVQSERDMAFQSLEEFKTPFIFPS